MENSINSDLIRGHINTIILKALYDGDRYGYDIIKDIEQKSSGQYKLKQPTLYSCLKRLESQGFISSYWGAKSNGGRRKYYTLTEMGQELFLKNQTDWEYSRTVIDRLISDKAFDLSAVESAAADEEQPISSESEEKELSDEEIEKEFNEELQEMPSPLPENADREIAAVAEVPAAEQPAYVYAGRNVEPEEMEKQMREAMDTAKIMNMLFEQKVNDADNVSYTEKLFNEPYVASPKLESANYFKDFPAEDEPNKVVEQSSVPKEVEPTDTYADSYAPSPVFDLYESNAETEREERKKELDFLRYDADVDSVNENELVINREYKNILGNLFEQTVSIPAEPQATAKAVEKEAAYQKQTILSDISEEDKQENERIQEKNFVKLENNVKDLGDGIKIRTHNSKAVKEYTSSNYFYSNKLMLYHYGILFGVSILEIVVMFLFIRVGLGIKQVAGSFHVDLLLYGLAIFGALVFPVVAAVLNFRNPEKRKRINFSLKSSLVFRVSLTVICAILVYLINLFCGMRLTSISGYVPSLFIPWVMCINFPISAVIFNLLYKSGKFAVE